MPTAVSHAIPTSVIPALAAGISIRSARPRCCGFGVDRVPARYPRRSGDLCITPFLPQQGEQVDQWPPAERGYDRPGCRPQELGRV